MKRRVLIHGFVSFAFAMTILSSESFFLESISLLGIGINLINMNHNR